MSKTIYMYMYMYSIYIVVHVYIQLYIYMLCPKFGLGQFMVCPVQTLDLRFAQPIHRLPKHAPMHPCSPECLHKCTSINQDWLCSMIFNQGDLILLFPFHPYLPHFRLQSEDCMTQTLQGLGVHPYITHFVKCYPRIAQPI